MGYVHTRRVASDGRMTQESFSYAAIPWYRWRPGWLQTYLRAHATWEDFQQQPQRQKLGGDWVQYWPPKDEPCRGMWFKKEDANNALMPWHEHIGAEENWY